MAMNPDEETVAQRPVGPRPTEAPVVTERRVDVRSVAGLRNQRDRVSWGAIWAGLLTALGVFLLLTLLAVAVGAQSVDAGAADAATVGQNSALITGIIALVSFFTGGYVAAASSAVRGRGAGLLNGFLVWALGTAIVLMLATFGLGQLFGALGTLFDRYRALGESVGNTNIDRNQVIVNIRASSVVAFVSLALPALAAAVGGWAGARTEDSDFAEGY